MVCLATKKCTVSEKRGIHPHNGRKDWTSPWIDSEPQTQQNPLSAKEVVVVGLSRLSHTKTIQHYTMIYFINNPIIVLYPVIISYYIVLYHIILYTFTRPVCLYIYRYIIHTYIYIHVPCIYTYVICMFTYAILLWHLWLSSVGENHQPFRGVPRHRRIDPWRWCSLDLGNMTWILSKIIPLYHEVNMKKCINR